MPGVHFLARRLSGLQPRVDARAAAEPPAFGPEFPLDLFI